MRGYGKFKHHCSRITTVPAKPQPVKSLRAKFIADSLADSHPLRLVQATSGAPGEH